MRSPAKEPNAHGARRIEARRGLEEARGWRYAALKAAFCTAALILIFVLGRLPVGPDRLRIGIATLGIVLFYTLLGWLTVRHFPESWPWRRP